MKKYTIYAVYLGVSLLLLYFIWHSIQTNTTMEPMTIETTDSPSEIPKKIWVFWDGTIPEAVELCIQTIKKQNPDYALVILDKENVLYYLPEVDFTTLNKIDTVQRYSDVIRLYILPKYGGIWVDSSTICQKSFDWIHDIQNKTGAEYIGYYTSAMTNDNMKDISPVVESWFFACTKNSTFMQDWRDEFMKIMKYDTIGEYVNQVKAQNIDLQKIKYPLYHTIHVACQVILQQNPDKYNLHLQKAEDSPLLPMIEKKDINEIVDSILQNNYPDLPFIKLVGHIRQPFMKKDYKSYFIDNQLV